jgi:hypothetical protein
VLNYLVGVLTIHVLLFAALSVHAEEVYGPPNAHQLIPSTQDKEAGGEIPTKELLDDASHPAQHALKSLPPKSDYTIIPLPAFASNPNEGYWVGVNPPILKADSKGEVKEVLMPQYLYNQKVGHYGSLNYFAYPSDTEQYHALAWFGQKLDQGIDLGYKNVDAGGYIFAADFNAFKEPFARFFGFGSRTTQAQETNYTSRELLVKLTAGIKFTPDLALMLTERYRNVRVDNGIVDSLPATAQQFPTISGVQGAQILGHGLTLRYDTRDSQLIPTKGAYVNILAEFNQNVQPHAENQWEYVALDARQFIPHGSGRMTFVARAFFAGVFGHIERRGTDLGVPFYEQPTLGGETTLRAFGNGRYIGSWAVLVNLEERISVLSKTISDLHAHLEIAPFLDIGRVGENSEKALRPFLKDLQFNPGIGFRLLIKPTVVGRFDVAYGRDGENVFVGIDYPF